MLNKGTTGKTKIAVLFQIHLNANLFSSCFAHIIVKMDTEMSFPVPLYLVLVIYILQFNLRVKTLLNFTFWKMEEPTAS